MATLQSYLFCGKSYLPVVCFFLGVGGREGGVVVGVCTFVLGKRNAGRCYSSMLLTHNIHLFQYNGTAIWGGVLRFYLCVS